MIRMKIQPPFKWGPAPVPPSSLATRPTEPLNPPRWRSPGGPTRHGWACSPCARAPGWSRDVARGLATGPGPGTGSSRPCTTSRRSPTSPRTTWERAAGRRARSHAPQSASMSWCATTTPMWSSRMRRTPTQTASWPRWEDSWSFSFINNLNEWPGWIFTFDLSKRSRVGVSLWFDWTRLRITVYRQTKDALIIAIT